MGNTRGVVRGSPERAENDYESDDPAAVTRMPEPRLRH